MHPFDASHDLQTSIWSLAYNNSDRVSYRGTTIGHSLNVLHLVFFSYFKFSAFRLQINFHYLKDVLQWEIWLSWSTKPLPTAPCWCWKSSTVVPDHYPRCTSYCCNTQCPGARRLLWTKEQTSSGFCLLTTDSISLSVIFLPRSIL